jgi:hypothetical protein
MINAALGADFGASNTGAVARLPDGRIGPGLFDDSSALPSAVLVNHRARPAAQVLRDSEDHHGRGDHDAYEDLGESDCGIGEVSPILGKATRTPNP